MELSSFVKWDFWTKLFEKEFWKLFEKEFWKLFEKEFWKLFEKEFWKLFEKEFWKLFKQVFSWKLFLVKFHINNFKKDFTKPF